MAARVKHEPTNLEMQAINMVNEEIMGPPITDEEKYNELLEKRQNRKAVSFNLKFHHSPNRAKTYTHSLKEKSRIKWAWQSDNRCRKSQRLC